MQKRKAILCDLDGTLAIIGSRSPFNAEKCDILDTPNKPVVECVKAMFNAGYEIVFVSGREDKYETPTKRFIDANVWPEATMRDYELFMRKSGDNRRDSIVKREIYDAKILPVYDVLFALDDRDQVVSECWRSIPIACFQVAPGAF